MTERTSLLQMALHQLGLGVSSQTTLCPLLAPGRMDKTSELLMCARLVIHTSLTTLQQTPNGHRKLVWALRLRIKFLVHTHLKLHQLHTL